MFFLLLSSEKIELQFQLSYNPQTVEPQLPIQYPHEAKFVKLISDEERENLMNFEFITIEETKKSVHLNNSEKYYRKLDNDTLRMKIPGEDKVTAKDIWLDALSCQDDWLFTTKNIAARWGIPVKRAINKLTLLSNSGFAEPRKIVDPKDNKILMHIWIFYESPRPQKRGHGKNDVNNCNDKSKSPEAPESHNPKNGVVAPFKNKQQSNKQQQGPAPIGAAAAVRKLRTHIDPLISKNLRESALIPLIEIPVEQIRKASDEAMASKINNKAGLFLKIAKEPLPETTLKAEPIPLDASQSQINCVKCYNANCERNEPTCPTMGAERKHPAGYCKTFCPFVLNHKELFK